MADQPVFISDIRFNQSGSKEQTQWLYRIGRFGVNRYMSESDINHAINIYRGTGAFDDITYLHLFRPRQSLRPLNAGLGASPDFQNNLLLVPFIRFCYDNLDDPYFAKSGINTTLSGPFGLTVQWSDFTKRIGVYFSVGYSF
ncbi:MAG: hypothetical protein IJQ11_13760 [Bacteroidales bacterium]|nr:hypothetical protein [Bacteroidales bacterium]